MDAGKSTRLLCGRCFFQSLTAAERTMDEIAVCPFFQKASATDLYATESGITMAADVVRNHYVQAEDVSCAMNVIE